MGPTALGIDPWGGGATAPVGQSPLVGWASSPRMLRVRWLNRDSSWLTTKPMRANACRRSRGTTTTIAGNNHHDLYLRPTAPLHHHLQRARVQGGPGCERFRRALVILCRHGVGGCQCSRRLCHGLHDTRPHRPEYGRSAEPPHQKCPRRRPTANGHLPRASIPPAARGTSTLANRLRPRPP